MSELLKCNVDIRPSERQSRYGSLNLICPRYKRETEGARTFQVSATRFWNSLPNNIKNSSSLEYRSVYIIILLILIIILIILLYLRLFIFYFI